MSVGPQANRAAPRDLPRPVAIVLVTWNALAHTRACLASLRPTIEGLPATVIAVDNGSSDGTPDYLAELGWVRCIRLETNRGFAAAVNVALREIESTRDVVLLNNDVRLDGEGWLARLAAEAHRHPWVGIVSARLLCIDGRLQEAGTELVFSPFRNRHHGSYETFADQFRAMRVVTAVSFGCAYLRRELLDRIGGLDEAFFCYYEDLDACLRARDAGFASCVSGAVTLLHDEHATSRANRLDPSLAQEDGRRIFVERWAASHERHRRRTVAIRIPEDARWPVRDLARRIALGLSRRGWVCAVVRRGADGRERPAEETSRDGRFDDLWRGVVAGDEAVRVELERDLHIRAHGIGGTQEWAPETGAYPAEGASLLLAPDPDYFFPVRAPARPMRTVLAFLDGDAGDRVVCAVSRLSKRVSGLRLVGLRSHPVPESPSVWTEPVRSLSADGIVEIRHFHWADAVQRLGAYRAADLAVIAGGGPEEALASLELAACALPILAAPGTLPGALDGERTSFRLPDRSAEAIEERLEEMLWRPDRSRLRGWRASRVVLRRSWTGFLGSFEESLSTIAGAGAPP